MYRFFVLSLFCFFLSACGGGSGSSARTSSTLPAEPDRTANNATLAGVDSDGDGVRDDVQRLIYRTYTSSTKRALATALAKETRKLYITPPMLPAEARKIADEKERVWGCIFSQKQIPFDERANILEIITASHSDTAGRMKVYLQYSELLHGQTFYSRSNEPGICDGILP